MYRHWRKDPKLIEEIDARNERVKFHQQVRKVSELECMQCHRISAEGDCNNLQCPFCGGNMRDVV